MNKTEPYLDCKTNEMVCPWCGKREVLLLPKSMKETIEELDLFRKLHYDCERLAKRKEQQSTILRPYFGSDMLDEYALLIFANNRQEAKVLLNKNMPHDDYEYTDLRVRRANKDYMLLSESDQPHVIDSFPWEGYWEQDGGEPSWDQYLQKVMEKQ